MGEPISFKAYLSREDGSLVKPEVRRFGIDREVVADFQYLREKLQTIFPNLRGKRFTVSWKDNDLDNVVISSDEELQIALSETQGSQIRKFFLTLYSDYEQQGTQASTSEQGVRHNGVTCDGCEKGVYGFRYKCIQCPDYDLCMDCEAQSLHPEHCMLRIPIPMQWKNHYTRRLARHMNRLHKTQSFYHPTDSSKECPYKSNRCEPRSRQCGDDASWMNIFANYVQDWTNVTNAGCPMKESEQPQQSQQKGPDTPKERESKTHSRKNSDAHVDFLKNIGEHIAQFLDPLGIDVNVQVKNDKAQNTTSGTNTPNSASTSAAAAADAAAASFSKVTKQNQSTEMKENMSGENATKVDEQLESDVPLNVSIETTVLEKSHTEPEGWTLLNDNDSPPMTSTSTPVPSRASSVAAEVPSTNSVQPSAPSEKISATMPQKPLYPPLPQEGKVPFHSNPKIQRAIETMMEMGFSNEGGWLTQLLVTKDGDISKALDILAPIRR